MRHVALVLASLLALFAAYALGASSAASRAGPKSLADDHERGLLLLAQIASDVRALRERLEATSELASPAPVVVREPAAPDANSLKPLVTRIEALIASLPFPSNTAHLASSENARSEATGWRSTDDLARDVRAVSADGRAAFERRLRSEHALWRIDDVLARYGPPTSVFPSNDSIAIEYLLAAGEPGANGSTVRFTVFQDRVTWANVTR